MRCVNLQGTLLNGQKLSMHKKYVSMPMFRIYVHSIMYISSGLTLKLQPQQQ